MKTTIQNTHFFHEPRTVAVSETSRSIVLTHLNIFEHSHYVNVIGNRW
jgi:hypothetical protein